ncbi:response regulator transcription factor [Chloroflexota bacterium]
MKKDIQVLLVDDHQVVCEGLQRLLESEKEINVVGQVCNSEKALSQIEMLSPDVVLMDVKMPGIDGIELTRRVKQKYHSCNVIILTWYDEYRTEAAKAGAIGYLLKGMNRDELVGAIRFACEGRSPLNLSSN